MTTETKSVKKSQRSGGARDRILDATLALVKEVGPELVTLDSVALKAGVSKGGLQYYFRHKEQLFHAANEHLVTRRIAAREEEQNKLPPSPTRALKSYVLASVKNSKGNDEISTRMIGAGLPSEGSGEPIRRYFKDRFPPFAEEVGFQRAALVHAATEGLWFMDVMGLSPFSETQRAELVQAILDVADGQPFEPVGSAVASAGRVTAKKPVATAVKRKSVIHPS